ncbi:MAG: sugar transferase [Archangiaceae bacterium]|nr:sugar transferase [Archangiaceae bacterium]
MAASRLKRALDLALALPAAAAAAPLVAALAVAVKLDSPGPAFFAQTRVGRGRRPLKIYKLRSMVADADKKGPAVTAGNDSRVTRVGRFIRKTKLDELPQLLNVLRGEMSLVGPRPEAPRYVEQYRPEWLELLDVRPGITDLASIAFRDEEALLADARDRERAYVEAVMPAKLGVAVEGVRRSSPLYDLGLIWKTFRAVVAPPREKHPAVEAAAFSIAQLNRDA